MNSVDTISRVRIVVLGDSGSGKSSFVQLACNGRPVLSPTWTIGASVEIKLHEYQAGTPEECPYFVEFWDVGGSQAHANSRGLFYQPLHGLILVHDLANRKSRDNLRNWLSEVMSVDFGPTSPIASPMSNLVTSSTSGYAQGSSGSRRRISPSRVVSPSDFLVSLDPEQMPFDRAVPMLIIGTKLDLSEWATKGLNSSGSWTPQPTMLAQEHHAEEINLCCHEVKSLAPGSNNSLKLTRFLDKVIQHQRKRSSLTAGPMFVERRRKFD